MNNTAVFAGKFDPFTLGHYEIAKRAASIFDKVYIAVLDGKTSSRCRGSISDRISIAKKSVSDLVNVEVEPFDSFLVSYMKGRGIGVIVRGLRNAVDFDYEKNLFNVYKFQSPDIEGCFLMSGNDYSHISSSLVREVLDLGGGVGAYVKPEALGDIIRVYG